MSQRADPSHILAFEPFDAGSHRAVRESIERHSQHHWTWFTRPGRFWKWRMRLSAVELLGQADDDGALDASIDAIFMTSLMSAADLRAMLPVHVRNVPIILYMHENQAAYPEGRTSPLSAERDLQFPLTNLTSVLAADRVIWNSAWNRDSFLDGIEQVLRFGPDVKVPDDLRSRIEGKSVVIWPPVEPPPERMAQLRERSSDGTIRVAWPHRWEHDKGPDELLAIAREHTESLNLRWTILGEQYRQTPDAMKSFEREFRGRIDHMGYEPDRERYWQHLARCDWVLSTARHEFFGIAVVEAMLAGCLPWLPERLSYRELLPASARGLSPMTPPDDAVRVREAIHEHLQPAVAANSVARIDGVFSDVSVGKRRRKRGSDVS